MKLLDALLEQTCAVVGGRLALPEYRQIELYTKKKKLLFTAPAAIDAIPVELADALQMFNLLDSHFAAQHAELGEGMNSWQRYLALPRRHTLDRVVAELYRILRICRIAGLHAAAHRESRDGLLRLACDFNHCALALNITPVGLRLLGGAVHVYLRSFEQPYSEAYNEALLLQYFFDIVGEIRKFADEDRVLYQFRQKYPYFNRHFRFDCDNPRLSQEHEQWRFEINPHQRDVLRYPIDFFWLMGEALYIVPVEALRDGCLPVAELPRWQARTANGALPAAFAMRFGREEMIVGLPMT